MNKRDNFRKKKTNCDEGLRGGGWGGLAAVRQSEGSARNVIKTKFPATLLNTF